MTWADFYLACFLVGFLLSVLSLVLGQLHAHFHLPHSIHAHLGHGGHAAGGHGGNAVHAGATHGAGAGHSVQTESTVSPFNFATLAAFLAWFGGSGYLMARYSTLWVALALGIAIACGLAGGGVVFWFLTKLISQDENLDPADYQMVGSLGRVVSHIREGGTGEIVYVQDGSRHTAGARSESGGPIARDTEVVVTRYEKGIAYVRRWEDLLAEQQATGGKQQATTGNEE